MKGILLTTLNAKYIHMNLAIRLLFELNKTDPRLSWKEFAIKEDLDLIANHCAEYEVVCFSCYIWNIRPTLKVIEKLKQSILQRASCWVDLKSVTTGWT